MRIKILGVGCEEHRKLEKATTRAMKELGLDCRVKTVDRVREIIRHGVIVTPALMVNGKVRVSGKVPPVQTIKQLLH